MSLLLLLQGPSGPVTQAGYRSIYGFWLGGLSAASAVVSLDVGLNIENLLQVQRAGQLNTQGLLGVLNNKSLNIEELLGITQSSNLSTEELLSILNNRVVNIESLLGVSNTRNLSIEEILSVLNNQTANIEELGGITSSKNTDVEILSSIISSKVLDTESLISAILNRVEDIEILAGVANSRIINIENMGTAAITSDANLDVDWLASKISAKILDIEELITVKRPLATGTAFDANWFNENTSDATIQAAGTSAYADGIIDRDDMIAILTAVVDSGSTVTSTQFTDLTTIANATVLFGNLDYVYDLTRNVVLNNSLNEMGNLAAGSPTSLLTQLVGKWFLGTDLPVQFYASYVTASGTLWDTGGPLYSDAVQGSALGDCFIIASLAEVALRNPQIIERMFIDNGDDTWTFRYYFSTSPYTDRGVPRYLTVNRQLPATAGSPFATWSSTQIWAALAEKAYAVLVGNAYSSLASGSTLQFLNKITGNTWSITYPSISDLDTLKAAFDSGELIGLETGLTPDNPDVTQQHAYAMLSYDYGAQTVTMYNPHGNVQTFSAADTFNTNNFRSIDVVDNNYDTPYDYTPPNTINDAFDIDWQLAANLSQICNIEILSGVVNARTINIENMGTSLITSDVRLNIDWLATIRFSGAINTETCSVVVKSSVLNIESLISALNSRTLSVNWLATIANSPDINVEWGGQQLIFSDGALNVDWLKTALNAPSLDIDYSNNLFKNSAFDVENLTSAFKNSGKNIDWLLFVNSNQSANTDWIGGKFVNLALDIENLASIQQNKTLNVANNLTLSKLSSINIDNLASLSKGNILQLEWLLNIFSSKVINAEWGGVHTIDSDGNLNVEWLGSLNSNKTLTQENLGKILSDKTTSFAWLIKSATPVTLNIEWLKLEDKAPIAYEVIIVSQRNNEIVVESRGFVIEDVEGGTVIQPGGRATVIEYPSRNTVWVP